MKLNNAYSKFTTLNANSHAPPKSQPSSLVPLLLYITNLESRQKIFKIKRGWILKTITTKVSTTTTAAAAVVWA